MAGLITIGIKRVRPGIAQRIQLFDDIALVVIRVGSDVAELVFRALLVALRSVGNGGALPRRVGAANQPSAVVIIKSGNGNPSAIGITLQVMRGDGREAGDAVAGVAGVLLQIRERAGIAVTVGNATQVAVAVVAVVQALAAHVSDLGDAVLAVSLEGDALPVTALNAGGAEAQRIAELVLDLLDAEVFVERVDGAIEQSEGVLGGIPRIGAVVQVNNAVVGRIGFHVECGLADDGQGGGVVEGLELDLRHGDGRATDTLIGVDGPEVVQTAIGQSNRNLVHADGLHTGFYGEGVGGDEPAIPRRHILFDNDVLPAGAPAIAEVEGLC